MPERQRGPEGREKREDLAFIIPAAGLILLMPLVANLFVVRILVFGVPLEVVYLFLVWSLLVAGAVGLAFWLPRSGAPLGAKGDEGAVKDMSEDR